MTTPPPPQTEILAVGSWSSESVSARWSEEHFDPGPEKVAAADLAIEDLRRRGSPSHDGLAARLVSVSEPGDGMLHIELQPLRWALRLVGGDASDSMAATCITRDCEGRWLAGRRAAWVASWPNRWALGAGGAVDLGENPFNTLTRELREEWAVEAERVEGRALVRLPTGLVMFVGVATLGAGAQVTRDPEHDEHAWWPADVADWPDEADEPLRRIAGMLA